MSTKLTFNDINHLQDTQIWSLMDYSVRDDFSKFVKEFNKSEYFVRIEGTHKSHTEYFLSSEHQHIPEFGHGFIINNQAIPYFHPNRSFHDEIIFLNQTVYYNEDANFADKLYNSALVKFYGPAGVMDLITGHADANYLTKTEWPFVKFDALLNDPDYELAIMQNIEAAFKNKQQIWGTTELRTSLQTEARNYSRLQRTPIDNLVDPNADVSDRKMRPSDMIFWLKHLVHDHWLEFYSGKPDMEESFKKLTSHRGIGNYYGYHFSSNLARMPGIGAPQLIEAEWKQHFSLLQKDDPNLSHGNIDENANYVMAGTGACITLQKLFPTIKIDSKTAMKLIIAIRDNQHEFFNISESDNSDLHLNKSTELGKFTTFGIEIACCQYSVFDRLRTDKLTAQKRAKSPISKFAEQKIQ